MDNAIDCVVLIQLKRIIKTRVDIPVGCEPKSNYSLRGFLGDKSNHAAGPYN